MLSILIPTYNYNCFPLVKKLYEQALNASISFEIIVLDDCSTVFVEENEKISEVPFCSYFQSKINKGRAKTRNELAVLAKYDFLLFIDADADTPDDQFIFRYLAYCNDNSIVCGGTIYNQKNVDPSFTLRLKYGKRREFRSLSARQENRYNSFSSFNFLIPKNIFQKIRFNESIVDYGHEDTVFGYELKLYQYNVIHIDNPLIHKGLEPSAAFLEKTQKSMRNLVFISKQFKYKHIISDIRVLRYYRLLEKLRLNTLYLKTFKFLESTISRNLLSKNPSLFLFDLYKLGYLSMAYNA
jgi:glycosyltransferase involved in cell wall biosynthesis